jgi:hypothetical protein
MPTSRRVPSASSASFPFAASHRPHWPSARRSGAEAGRLWTDLVRLHTQARAQGRWLDAGELEQATKGAQYALHSQSVQALCQKFAANVDTATALRKQELSETRRIQTQYPHHPKAYQTVVCKDQALTILPSGQLRLSTGGQRPPSSSPCQRNIRSDPAPGRADLASGSLRGAPHPRNGGRRPCPHPAAGRETAGVIRARSMSRA